MLNFWFWSLFSPTQIKEATMSAKRWMAELSPYLHGDWDKLPLRSAAGGLGDVPRSYPSPWCLLALIWCSSAGITRNHLSPPLANWKAWIICRKVVSLTSFNKCLIKIALKIGSSWKAREQKEMFWKNKNSVLETVWVVGRQNSTGLKNWGSETRQSGLNAVLSLTGRLQTRSITALFLPSWGEVVILTSLVIWQLNEWTHLAHRLTGKK